MTTVLITGLEGFVGRHIADAAEVRQYVCIGLDRPQAISAADSFPAADGKSPPHGRPLRARFGVDITDGDRLRSVLQRAFEENGPPEYVFHMAAQASVADSFDSPARTYATNVVGTAVVLEILADLVPDSRVLVPSSAYVYGPPRDTGGLLTETSLVHPDTHYGASKAVQETIGRLFYERRGLPVHLTRAFNHCGPGQGPGFVFSDFARRLALLERHGGGTLDVGNLEAARDFLDVRDVVAAYFTVLERGEPAFPYNVASGTPMRIGDILAAFLEEVSVDVEVRVNQSLVRPVDVPVLAGDASRLRHLGWEPTRYLCDTIRETLDYWRDRITHGEVDIA